MKNNSFFLLLLLLSFIAKPSYSQDFWEIVPTPDTIRNKTLSIHPNGDVFLGTADIWDYQGGVYLSTDNGETWEFKGLLGKSIFSLAIDSVGNIFAGSSGILYKSTDHGNSWYSVIDGIDNILAIECVNNGLMFAGSGHTIGIVRSLNYGENWDTVFIVPGWEEYVYDIKKGPDNTIFAGTTAWMGNGGGVYRSVNNGETWEHIGLLYHYVQALSINSSGSLFAAVYGHHYTGIGGCYFYDEITSDWIILTENLNSMDIAINSNGDIFLGVSDAVGGLGGVYRSLDEGETWQRINDGLSFKSIVVLFISPDYYIFSFTYGIYELHKSINPTVSVINKQSHNIEVDMFPNPFVESLYFKINSTASSNNCSLVIFNIKGALIKKVGFKHRGNNQIFSINANDWISGVYLYNVIVDNYNYTGNIIKTK